MHKSLQKNRSLRNIFDFVFQKKSANISPEEFLHEFLRPWRISWRTHKLETLGKYPEIRSEVVLRFIHGKNLKKNHGRFSVAEGITRRITIGIPA